MVIQKTVMYKVLAVALVLMLWWGSSERVEAAQSFEYYLDNYYHMYSNDSGAYGKNYKCFDICNDENFKHVQLYCPDNNYYTLYFYVVNPDFTPNVQTYHDEWIIFTDNSQRNNFSTSSTLDSWSDFQYFKSDSGDDVYYYMLWENVKNTGDRYGYYFTNLNMYYVENWKDFPVAYNNYISKGVIPDEYDVPPFYPDWGSVGTDPLLMLRDMIAEVNEDNVYVRWKYPKNDIPYKYLEHVYVRFDYTTQCNDSALSVGRPKYVILDSYAKLTDLEISIPLSEFTTLQDNWHISSIMATPYYYIGDDTNNNTKSGMASVVYFDSDGVSSAPVPVDPEIEYEIPVEDTEQSIFITIQNFFSNFYTNLMSTIKAAFIPESKDLLALLQEMNDWFSERFGFIWYPFDLALDIVAAFAMGEADSKLTVPALTLNMFDGVKIWDSFEADLDPIDFLKYVRFFTSAIMCCGTVSLAIKKWDEWIGGEH